MKTQLYFSSRSAFVVRIVLRKKISGRNTDVQEFLIPSDGLCFVEVTSQRRKKSRRNVPLPKGIDGFSFAEKLIVDPH